jgi:large subunit ribosomal protein L28e
MESADLIWACVRKNSSFLLKNHGNALTREPGNLANRNTQKFSGLANKRTVHVSSISRKNIAVRIKTTQRGRMHRPTRAIRTMILRPGQTHTLKAIKGITNSYRKDLAPMALARATALMRYQRIKRHPLKRVPPRARHVSRHFRKLFQSVKTKERAALPHEVKKKIKKAKAHAEHFAWKSRCHKIYRSKQQRKEKKEALKAQKARSKAQSEKAKAANAAKAK